MIFFNNIKILFLISLLVFLQGSTFVIDPATNAVMHNNNGMQYLQDGEYLAAIYEFKIAISLCPNTSATATFYNNLGLTYQKLAKYDWALTCFQKAININPNFLDYYSNMVKVYRLKKILNPTLLKYKKITDKNASNSQGWLMLGLINRELGNMDEAVACFERFVNLEPDLVISQGVTNLINELK